MKLIVQAIILFSSIGAFACDCDEPGITEKYQHSDFIADVTILKIYPNTKNESGYKADIQVNELYKGEKLKTIYVDGRSDGGIGTSCDIYIPTGTRLIIYANKNKYGNYLTGMCSGNLYLDNKNKKRQLKEDEILDTLKGNENRWSSTIYYREKGNLYNELRKFKGIELEKTFAIYEITFAQDLTIKGVKEISGFNNRVDKELLQILKNSKWSSNNYRLQDEVPDNSKLLVGIFYYPADKTNKSFLSHYYL